MTCFCCLPVPSTAFQYGESRHAVSVLEIREPSFFHVRIWIAREPFALASDTPFSFLLYLVHMDFHSVTRHFFLPAVPMFLFEILS